MRLIDGNRIVISLADWWYSSFGQEETEESKAIKKVMGQVEKMVMEMPEIVRCKYRKWQEQHLCMNKDAHAYYLEVDADDYCRYGERNEESITIQTGQTYGKSANISKDICEQIKKHAERIKEETEKNPDSLWSKGMRSFDGWELTGKLNNLDDFLLREESKGCKEQKSKLDTDLISRQAAIEALTGWETDPTDEEIMRTLKALPPTEPKPVCEDEICELKERADDAEGRLYELEEAVHLLKQTVWQ